ncbi:DUF551 domain-containing protein [Enterobacter kobei]|uniref:DUF551 domain-containing protein n=1 Tax=Enterobacter kobei TaxID=208224 RepID=UPI003B83E1FB
MSTLTKEWLQQTIAELEEERNATPGAVNEDAANAIAAMKLALASIEAEAVGEVVLGEYDDCGCHPDAKVVCIAADGQADWENFKDGTRLYTAPPAPVSVPAAMEMDDDFDSAFEHGKAVGWNACRAAMLQGADGNSKWVACSERMPEKGRTLALFGKRIKEVCANYVDEGYIGDDGEFYFFDWEGGPRIDDCHPYDKAIVTHWMYWELPAAPKGEHRDAYDIEAFGIFSATEGENGLMLQIERFRFGTEKCPQIGKVNMVPKFALQGVINRLQEHCDSMGNEALVDILSTATVNRHAFNRHLRVI